MLRYIYDLETDGLLDTVTKIHCAVLVDIATGEVVGFRGHEIDKFLDCLEQANEIWGHNSIRFDEQVIKKLYPDRVLPKRSFDTMVLARLLYPAIKDEDFERVNRERRLGKENGFPAKLIGSHSLAAWGMRLGNPKGDFDGGDWQTFSEEMFDYMLQDGEVTLALYRHLMKSSPSPLSVDLEHRIARLCYKMEESGFPFDTQSAIALYGRMVDERQALHTELLTLFPKWQVALPPFVPKVNNKARGYVKGEPIERFKEVEFNPASRDHIADRLIDKYGWKPVEMTETGKPKIDDDVLAALPYPEAQKLARYFLLEKRIGQIAEGSQAWLKVQKNGKIHARYNTNGAVTGRATHSHPNISQVPRVSSAFGRDCRALFGVPDGWVQIGADQQGLELRCLASDLSRVAKDGGAYAKVICEGDVHTTNQLAAGLPTRDKAKTFIYALIYGAGDFKIGSIIGGKASEGKLLRESFFKKTPGLEYLVKKVKKVAANTKSINGIDGRRVPVRSTHAALNMRLQSSGAILCKQWGCDWYDALIALGLRYGWDGDFVFLSWSHDEYQLAVRDDPALIEQVKQAGIATGRAAGEPYGFECPLDVDVKVGRNWAECH